MSKMTVQRGLDNILSGGTNFIKFEDGQPLTLLFLDWYEDLVGIREHYEKALNPSYIRCPGKEVCPLCHANPEKYPALKIKFRVYDPSDNKIKFVSMAKTHIQKLNTEFNLDEIDPTKSFVTIYRSGKGASDTSYSARRYVADPNNNRPELQVPNFEELDVPDIETQATPHTPEQIQGFMDALLAGAQNQPPQGQQQFGQNQGQFNQPQQQFNQNQGQFNQQGQQQFNQNQGQQQFNQPQGQQFDQGQQQQGQQQFNQPQQGQGQQQFNQPQGGQPQGGQQGQRKLPF